MTADTQTSTVLIRLLVGRFIDHPAILTIKTVERPQFVTWTMQGHADDHSKLVGKLGAHYYALKLLIAEMGRANDAQYVLKRFLEPEPAERRERMPRKKLDRYDPSPPADLLRSILASLSLGQFSVEVEPDPIDKNNPLAFLMAIYLRDAEDYKTLTVTREEHEITLIGAIGTLYRAYGNREGCKFTLEAKRT